jgi:hypothetical protein
VYRIAYALFVLLAVLPVAPWLGREPAAFFNPPPGPAALFAGFAPGGLVLALNCALAVLLALLLVGWRTAWASAGVGILLLALKSCEYADGKINHDILLVLTPLLLAASGWGRMWSLDAVRAPVADPDTPRPAWPLALLAFVIGLAMLWAGALKLVTGWANPAVHATYGYLVVSTRGAGRSTWLSALALATDSPLLWKPADWLTLALEVGFIATVFHPRTLRLALSLACLFHLGIWLLFDIVFSPNVVAYGAFVAWGRRPAAWFRGARIAFRDGALRPGAAAGALAGVAAVAAISIAAGRPLEELLRLQLNEALVVAGAVVGARHLLATARATRARPRGGAGPNTPDPSCRPDTPLAGRRAPILRGWG